MSWRSRAQWRKRCSWWGKDIRLWDEGFACRTESPHLATRTYAARPCWGTDAWPSSSCEGKWKVRVMQCAPNHCWTQSWLPCPRSLACLLPSCFSDFVTYLRPQGLSIGVIIINKVRVVGPRWYGPIQTFIRKCMLNLCYDQLKMGRM